MSRSIVRAVLLVLAVGALAAPAAGAKPRTAKLSANVEIERFIVGKDGIRALGYATTDVGKNHKTRRVTLQVKTGQTCSVLTLSIERLNLVLLGLNLDTSAINLEVRGDSRRTLGRLFCRLSRQLSLDGIGGGGGKSGDGKKKKARSIVRTLNRRLGEKRMPAVGFHGRITARQAQSEYAPCKVLDLVLGPVHVDLIGLIVDLYGAKKNDPVTATVTADPNAGVLGERFCELAGQPV